MPRRGVRARVVAGCLATVISGPIGVSTPSAQATSPVLPSSSKIVQSLLQHTVHRIPTYRPGSVRWRLSLSLKTWGTTDWNHGIITISVLVPLKDLYSVVAHEWSHELSVLDYHGDVWTAIKAMNKHFGGGGKNGLHGTEIAADCMARLQGATWTHYTNCQRPRWRHDARRLVHGHRL